MAISKRNLAMRVSLLAAAVAGTIGMSAGAAGAAPAHASTAGLSVAGKYSYTDNLYDHGEGLTLNANGTLAFSSGCTGIWVKSGSSIAMDINAGCTNTYWIFSGAVTATGLSSKLNPGHLIETGKISAKGSWYAVRV